MRSTHGSYSWVDRYIFPGGELPSLKEIELLTKAYTGFEIGLVRRLSDSYARTLQAWRERFLAAAGNVRDLGFDERFVRLWALYFSYFEAGFRARYCDVWQVGMRK
jgi:cyclopropane-fatty-acyl-phospholipid synthase